MIAPLCQPPPVEVFIPPRFTRAHQRAQCRVALLVMALGFFCFLPYPSIPVGTSTAIQAGNVLTLLAMLPLLMISWRNKPYWIVPLMIAPLCLSVVKVALVNGDDLDLSLKASFVMAMSCLTILAAQYYAPRHALSLLTGIAWATLLHVAVGLWQFRCFASGDFPFYRLYVNPSFLTVQGNAEIIAKYIQRPFGLFPEPSAMACSLAPWVLFWAAHLLGVIQLRQQPSRRQKALFTSAAAGGLLLMILSQSGHAIITLAGLSVIGLLWIVRAKATTKTFLTLLSVIGILLPLVIWLAIVSLSDRFEGKSSMGNSSWGDRSASLVIGFKVVAQSDPITGVFGIGPGRISPAVMRVSGLEAVWSVLLSYIYETGLIGGLAVGAVGIYLLRLWKSIGFDLVFAAIFIVWLVGVTITTSYDQLLPQWLALGWMTVWPTICRPRQTWASLFQPTSFTGSRSFETGLLADAPLNWGGR